MKSQFSLIKQCAVIFLVLFSATQAFGQLPEYFQYFDYPDSTGPNILEVFIDTTADNIWQVGPPQKTIFKSASTIPNVMVTDTSNLYPIGNTSSFSFRVNVTQLPTNILAIQWVQKLNLDSANAGGLVEFSVDSGQTWLNAHTSPFAYNFFGFQNSNVAQLPNGAQGFTGTDTNWRNVWLCIDANWAQTYTDSVRFRYTFISDSTATPQEGWMIDNLFATATWVHTLAEFGQNEVFQVYPNPAADIITVEANSPDIRGRQVDQIKLMDSEGRVLQLFGASPAKFNIDIQDYPNGTYMVEVKSEGATEVVKFLIAR